MKTTHIKIVTTVFILMFITSIAAINVTAPRHIGNDELDTSITYQGQLIDAGVPINGTADIKLTLLDSAVDGSQISPIELFDNVVITEGRFAVNPDFGIDAFNGSKRWIEIDVRSPSGVGEYITLSPRQEVKATPYALFALNSQEGPQGEPGDSRWILNEQTGDIGYSDGRVGVGTISPNGMFEVVGEPNDETVILPENSISAFELNFSPAHAGVFSATVSGNNSDFWTLVAPEAGFFHLDFGGTYDRTGYSNCGVTSLGIYLNGEYIGNLSRLQTIVVQTGRTIGWCYGNFVVPANAGDNSLELRAFIEDPNCITSLVYDLKPNVAYIPSPLTIFHQP